MRQNEIKVSFEFCPPNTDKNLEKLLQAAGKLNELNPEFFSVTYGAGGTTQEGTKNAVCKLREDFSTPVMPHLSCIGSTKAHIRSIIREYVAMDIKRIIALRGDLPSGTHDVGEFSYANELVEFIRKETGDHFIIKVAAYPEFHPEAKTPQIDLKNFKRKVDAGADYAITQYFFNPDAYFHFMDDCRRMGVDIHIIPGIMPISNWEKLLQFSQMCGTELPRWLCQRMISFGGDANARRDYGCEVVTKMCEKLLDSGVPELHFYTLNQSQLTLKVCENLGIKAK